MFVCMLKCVDSYYMEVEKQWLLMLWTAVVYINTFNPCVILVRADIAIHAATDKFNGHFSFITWTVYVAKGGSLIFEQMIFHWYTKPTHNWMVPFLSFINCVICTWSVLTTGDTLITAIPQKFVSIAQLHTWWIAITQQFITTVTHDQHCMTSFWISYKLWLEYNHKHSSWDALCCVLDQETACSIWTWTLRCWYQCHSNTIRLLLPMQIKAQ